MATTPTKEYYSLLGIKKTATADEIRKAFRKLARKHHPDVNPGDKKAEERFKEISEANDVLSDEKKRKVYDALGYYSDQIDPATAEAAARVEDVKQTAQAFAMAFSNPEHEREKVYTLYEKLIEARTETGERSTTPSLKDFEKFVQHKTKELKDKGGREIEYTVSIEGGRVKLKARVSS